MENFKFKRQTSNFSAALVYKMVNIRAPDYYVEECLEECLAQRSLARTASSIVDLLILSLVMFYNIT